MDNLKHRFGLKFAVFAAILVVLFWLIPSGMVFGGGKEGGGATPTITELEAAVTEAEAELLEAQAKLAAANTALKNAKSAVESAIQNVSVAQNAVNLANQELIAAQEAAIPFNQAITTAEAKLEAAKNNLSNAQTIKDNADSKLLIAQANLDETIAVLADANIKLEAAKKALFDALTAIEEGKNNDETIVLIPTLYTDKIDYHPEETVKISGKGFLPKETYTIVVIRPVGPDGLSSIVTGDGTFTPGSDSITTDSNGEFNYDYILDGILGTYQVKAVDSSGSTIAEITFTDKYHNIQSKNWRYCF